LSVVHLAEEALLDFESFGQKSTRGLLNSLVITSKLEGYRLP
jgi:hypothetical protein